MSLGRVLIIVGLSLAGLGCLLLLGGKWNVPFGRLPGDLVWRGRSTTVYFPWVTSVLLSVMATILLWLFSGRR